VLFNEKLIKCTTVSNTPGGDTTRVTGEGSSSHASSPQVSNTGGTSNANQNSNIASGSAPTVGTQNPGSTEDVTSSSQNDEVPSAKIPDLVKPENNKAIVSAMLKNYNGVKVTGTCGADFGLFLVPHIYVHVKSQDTEIELSSELAPPEMATKFDKTKLKNDCQKDVTKKFKFVAYINKDVLVFKWKVYTEGTNKEQNVDVMKYLLPNLKQPITSIQVHSWTGNKDSYILESKDYVLGDGMPEKCDAIATDCFLSGFTDIGKCFQCKLLMQEKNTNDSCFKYVSENQKELINHQLEVKGQDDEESSEYQLRESVRNILKNMYKKNDDNKKKELLDFENVNNDLKSELLNYCNLLKELDMNNLLKDHELGNEEDIFNNLTKLLEEHKEENDNVLSHKMKNEALCLKNINDWMKNKTGLVLPQLTYDLTDENNDFTELTQNKNYTSENIVDKLYCNNEYCNRLKDHNNCVSKINVEDQKNCALSWAFASKYHLETIKCMKGYEPVNTSALYVANCGKNENKDVCTEGSNPLVFLQTVEEKGFLPTELNYPYDESKVGDACPEVQNDWDNAFENAKVLDYNNEPFSLGTKGYTAYESEHFKNNMDTFVKLIKDEIKNKGSVIAYVKAENVLGYELNGKKVQKLCGDKTPDHAVNIVGYGNYINDEDEKKSYWLVRNSWGKYWGDDGYFKVDMYGPSNCENNFIHSVVVFNVEVPVNENFDKKENDKFKYYLKNSPDFYHNIYYKNYNLEKHVSPMNTWGKGLHNKLNNDNLVFGQESTGPTVGQSPASEAGNLRGDASGNSQEDQGQSSRTSGSGDSSERSHVSTDVNPGGSPSVDRSPSEGSGGSSSVNSSEQSATQRGSEGGNASLPSSSQEGTNTSPSAVDTSTPPSVPTSADAPSQPSAVNTSTPPSVPTSAAAPLQPSAVPNAEETSTSSPRNEQTPPVVPPQTAVNSKKAQIFHVLKHIKDSKIKMGLVKYENSDNIGADHVCSRTTAVNPEKQEECVKFCDDNWDKCKDKPSPGYCLTKLKETNECFFCYV
ncbi:serine repeat antigen 4, partial [Plasmodium gaboni]